MKKKETIKDVPSDWRLGNIHRLQGLLLPHANTKSVQEVPIFSRPGSLLPVQSTDIWSVHSTHGIHGSGEGSQTDDFTQGYKMSPVPRRLVDQSQIPPNLSPAYTNSGGFMLGAGLDDKHGKIRTGPQTSIRFHRLKVGPEEGHS